MDRRLNKRLETYISGFKEQIKNKIIELDVFATDTTKRNELVEFIYNYERLIISKEDVSKRKRIKNAIPGENRCNATRANGEQCTRKRKEGHDYCGTHVKGTPHGVVLADKNKESDVVKSEVFAEDVHGIIYYIDKFNNVYKTEDIMNGKENPEIIAKCECVDGKYKIPAFGLV